jgi:hypothetical protein
VKNKAIFTHSRKTKKKSPGVIVPGDVEIHSRPTNCIVLYFYGRSDGYDVNFGQSGTIEGARGRVGDHTKVAAHSGHDYDTVLALLWAKKSDEAFLKDLWEKQGFLYKLPRETEIVLANEEVRGFLRYMRTKTYVTDEFNELRYLPYVSSNEWLSDPLQVREISVNNERADITPKKKLGGPWRDVLKSVTTDGDYYTNKVIIRLARAAMGSIDLDPASCKLANTVVQATEIFTIHQAQKPWYGNVWINPPFGEWDIWAPLIIQAIKSGKVKQICVYVTANAASAAQFENILGRYTYAKCTVGRSTLAKCWGPKATSNPGEGVIIHYWGDRIGEFISEFSKIGSIWINPNPGDGKTVDTAKVLMIINVLFNHYISDCKEAKMDEDIGRDVADISKRLGELRNIINRKNN